MRINLLFFSFFSFYSFWLSAQDTAGVVDRVYTSDHKIYTGQITEDHKGDSLTIDVYRDGIYTIDYRKITKIQYRIDNPGYKDPEAVVQPRAAHREVTDTTLDLVAFNGYRASPRVTDKLIKKRNIGIGLVIGGVCLAGVGAALYTALPKQSVTNSGGYLVSTPSVSSIAGVLMMAGGIGITIPGAALWGSFTHKIHKAEREN